MSTQDKKISGKGDSYNTDNTIYSPKRVAEILEVKESFVKRQLREGNLQGFKLGKFWRVPKAALDEFCATCNGNGNDKGKVSEDTRNRIQFHAALRSQEAIPSSLEAMEQTINSIKAKVKDEEGYKKIATIAKLKAVVAEREQKKQKLQGIANLDELAEKAYPGLRDLADQDPDALEAYFIHGGEVEKDDEQVGKENHPAKKLMVAGKV